MNNRRAGVEVPNQHNHDRTPEIAGAVLIADIEASVAQLADIYRGEERIFDKYQSYSFDNEKGLLEYIGIPKQLQAWIEQNSDTNNPATVTEAVIDINSGIGIKPASRNMIGLSFFVKMDESTTAIIRTVTPDPENPTHNDTVSTYSKTTLGDGSEGSPVRETRNQKVFNDQSEIYQFISSLHFLNYQDLSASYLEHPQHYTNYVHNPFSLSDIHRGMQRYANTVLVENTYRLADPSTNLPIDLTISDKTINSDNTSKESTYIEIETWDDFERTESTCVSMDTSEKTELLETSDELRIPLPPYLEKSLLDFSQDDEVFVPDVNTLEEIKSRLSELVYISDITASVEVYDSYDYVTGEYADIAEIDYSEESTLE